MSTAASRRPTTRSISSTIVNFFKKEDSPEVRESSPIDVPSSDSAFNPPDEAAAPPGPKLILFECDENARPPLLPILPVQRLRILRYKQYLRRLQDSALLEPIKAQPDIATTSYDHSHLVSLRMPKKRAKNQISIRQTPPLKSVLGKRWCGDIQYDFAEYDVVKKPKTSTTSSTMDHTLALESPSLSHTALKRNTLDKSSSGSEGLSKMQIDLLNGKALTDFASKEGTNDTEAKVQLANDNDKPKKMLALPSSGFDFLKADAKADNETGKTSSENESTKPLLSFGALKSKEPSASTEPLSKFSQAAQSDGSKKEPGESTKLPSFGNGAQKRSFNFGEADDKKPSFSFGKPETTKSSISNERDSDKNSKDLEGSAIKPAFSLKPDTQSPKPAFSFTNTDSSKGKAQNETGNKETVPAFSFGTGSNTKPAFSFGKAPEKSSTADQADKPDVTSTDGVPKQGPSFSFGASKSDTSAENKVATPSFSFGAAKGDTSALDKKATPSFTFGAKKSTESKDTPSFSFGAPKQPEDAKKDDKSALPKETTPSAAFSENESTGSKSSFNFGAPLGNTKEASLPTQLDSKKSFTFGAASETKSSTPPTLSFNPTNANASQPSSTGSGFKFDTSVLKNANPPNPKPTFNFGAGTAASQAGKGTSNPAAIFTAPQPQPGAPALAFNGAPSIVPTQPNGLGFASSSTTSNNSPAFGGTTNNQQLAFNFGTSNNTASPTPPPFGSAPAPVFAPSDPQSRTFSPSHTVNLNFGGATSQPPSSIFAGNPNPNPAQVFGGSTPNVGQSFGTMPQNPAQIFGGSSTSSLPQQNQPPAMLNLPPGRKLARMRARRN